MGAVNCPFWGGRLAGGFMCGSSSEMLLKVSDIAHKNKGTPFQHATGLLCCCDLHKRQLRDRRKRGTKGVLFVLKRAGLMEDG